MSRKKTIKLPCSVENCPRIRKAKGLCSLHYQRTKSGTDFSLPELKRHKNEICSVEGCIDKRTTSDMCSFHFQRKYQGISFDQPRHARQGEGTITSAGYKATQKNGNKLDNRIENLELWVKKQPAGQRHEDLIVYAKEILNTYDDLIPEEDAHYW